LRKAVVRLRAAAGLTQRRLARKLRCPQNTVLRIEQGERRIDLVEFWRICRACGASFEETVLEFARAWKKLESRRKGK
jgi:transcriptional regulator with XRE-family HTH domain